MARNGKGEVTMRCKECRKKITLDHYMVVNRPDASKETLELVFYCDCAFYVIPLDLVGTGEFRGWVSSEEIVHRKRSGEQACDGGKLSQQARKIYHNKGEGAYERWKEDVYFRLVEARVKKIPPPPQIKKH